MTPLLFVLLSIAGGLGASARLALDTVIRARVRGGFPVGTTVINVTGSLLLGLLTAVVVGGLVPEQFQHVLGAGFLGGYTTFSTASLETVRMLQERRILAAAANGLGMLVLCVLAAFGGLWLGSLLV